MTIRARKTYRLIFLSQVRIIFWPCLKRSSRRKLLSLHCNLFIIFMIFQIITTFLTPPIFAQPSSELGPSCENKPSREFPIEKLSQEDTPWCWAVTSAIVMAQHNKHLRPCDLVSLRLINSEGEFVDCCDAGGVNYDKCLIRSSISKTLEDNSFKFDYKPISNRDDRDKDLSYRNISEQLCSNGPFISTISAPKIKHAIVVYGYFIDDGADDPADKWQVLVHDSQEESQPPFVNHDSFLEAGRLEHTGRHFSFCNNAGNDCPSN